jgi:hypothetical protein
VRAVAIAALVVFAVAGLGSPGKAVLSTQPAGFGAAGLQGGPLRLRDRVLVGPRLPAAALAARFWGGPVTASTGEMVNVQVSDSYPVDPAFQQSIADFLAQLYHGSELQAAVFYVGTPAEVGRYCGSGEGGCYQQGMRRLFVPGEDLPGPISKETILAHEYGHYVADNRLNPPWPSLDWGPKRWATGENVCARRKQGTAFPGDESDHYSLNPGEAWAETYRLLNFQKLNWPGWVFSPSQVDPSFSPGPAAFAAAKDDVLTPWTAPRVRTVTGHLTAASRTRPLRRKIVTPLDGLVTVRLGRAPVGATVAIESPTRIVLRRPARRLTYTVCGSRSLVLVVRAGRPGTFSLAVSTP